MLAIHIPARRCFLAPIPQLSAAADLLASAGDCLLAGDVANARKLVAEADMPVIATYTALVTGAVNPLIHWQFAMPAASSELERSAQRMPSSTSEHAIYVRDGWRCRYCGKRVIDRSMRMRLHRCLPSTARWGARNTDKHTALAALSASLDHVVPHSRGGTNDELNLVTACNACQFGRGQWTLEEVGFVDPRDFAPIRDAWDGLMRLSRLATTSNDLQ
jgi:hypothetical protein